MNNTQRMHAVVLAALLMPTASAMAATAASLGALACAAGVHCRAGLSASDAQIVLNLSEAQAQAAFIEASQDWPDTAWRCAAGGRTCGAITKSDAQILIGLPEQAYGPAEQLRERGAPRETTPPQTTPAPRREPAVAKPGIVVETLPAPGAGGYREVPLPGASPASGAGDIQPLDGVWTLSAGTPRAVGCMAGIAESVVRSMPAPQSGSVVFEKPFNARQLIKSDKITWKRLGPNHYAGQLTGASAAMGMGYDVRVTSASRMQWQSVVTVRIPGQPVCTITTPLSHVRQGS